jgi:hypothetical protein
MAMGTLVFWMLASIPLLEGAPSTALDLKSMVAEEASLELEAFWEPIADSTYQIHRQHPQLLQLKPAQARREYAAEDWRRLLPEGPVEIGAVWSLDAEDVLPFVRQLHATATLEQHHPHSVEGARCLLRALSDDYVEVLLRVHPSFPLSQKHSFLTPAQLQGRLLLERRTGRVQSFSLALPPRNSNAVILMSPSADIVFIPRLELSGGTPPEDILWSEEVPLEQAHEIVRWSYPFMDIPWLPWSEALDVAEIDEKPLHVVVLFGSLDDESC